MVIVLEPLPPYRSRWEASLPCGKRQESGVWGVGAPRLGTDCASLWGSPRQLANGDADQRKRSDPRPVISEILLVTNQVFLKYTLE